MGPNVIRDKSFAFSVAIVRFARRLRDEAHEFELSSQILKSGTSIGANVEEALSGASKRDFINKLAIAAKEARETHYWLRVIRGAEIRADSEISSLLVDCAELLRILNSIILTSQKTLPTKAVTAK